MNEESALQSVAFWASPLIGLIDIATAYFQAYRRSDAVGWMSLATISLVIVGLFISSAVIRKTLSTLHERTPEKALERLTSSISVFPVIAYCAIQAALALARH